MDEIDDTRERMIAKLTEAGGKLKVRNAMNPILWMCGIVGTPCLVTLGAVKEPHWLISTTLASCIGTALFSYLFLLFFDRDRLQSEEFNIQRRTLDLIEQKGSRKAIDAGTVKAISQTEFLALPEPGGDEP